MDIREEIKNINSFSDAVLNGVINSQELRSIEWTYENIVDCVGIILRHLRSQAQSWLLAAQHDDDAVHYVLRHVWDSSKAEKYGNSSPEVREMRDKMDTLEGMHCILKRRISEYEDLIGRIEERLERLSRLEGEADEARDALIHGELTDAMREAEAVLTKLKARL